MSDLDLNTILAYTAGLAVFLCAVMAVYWRMQRVHPGFGYWTACGVLVAVACLLLADRRHFPSFVTILVIPTLLILGTVMRLEGLRRFLGRPRFDHRVLLVPMVAVALLAVFEYASENTAARLIVTTTAIGLLYGVMAAVALLSAKERHRLFNRWLGVLCVLCGVLWLALGFHFLVRSGASLLVSPSTGDFAALITITLFEVFWLIACLLLNAKQTADTLEATRGVIESERRQLAQIVAFLPDATFVLDKDRQVIAWNRAMEDLTGVGAEDVVGKPYDQGARGALKDRAETLLDLVLDETAPVPSRYRSFKRDGDKLSAEEDIEFPRGGGRSVHLSLTAALLRDADGTVMGAIESMRDVTWREEGERALRESEQRYRSLFEQSLDGILAIAPGGTVLDANSAACRMLGMTREELCAADSSGLTRRSADASDDLQDQTTFGTMVQELLFVRKNGTTFPAECMSVVWNDAADRLRAFVQFRDISERLETRRIVRESEARLREAQAAAHVGSWEVDLAAQSVWASPEVFRIYGVERMSPYFPLRSADLSVLAEDPDLLVKTREEVMSRGGSYDIEYQIRRLNDGALRTVHALGSTVSNEAGTPVKVVGALQDVTDLKRAKSAPDLTEHSADHAEDQVFWIGPDGRFMFVSDSTCRQLGYTREELLSMTIQDVDPNVDANWVEGWETVKSLGSRRIETIHRTKDGRDIPVEASVNYILHDGQEYNFVFAQDVSGRKRLEDALRKTQFSVDRSGDQIFWTSPEGQFAFVTDSTCSRLGYTREELLKMTIYDVDPTLSGDWRGEWAKVKQLGTITRETVHRTKDGREIPVEVSVNYVEYEGNEYSLVFARSMSDQTRAARRAGKAEMETLQFQKLEAVGQLAGGIAHDFNSLLTAIIGYGNLILANEEAQGLASLRRDAEEIREAAERAASLTSQILAFARRQALRPRVASLSELIAGMEKRLRPILGDDVELVIVEQREPSCVEVDTEQFEQVVVNLVKNACEAMPEGGRLALEVRDVDLTEEYSAAYPEVRPGNYVLLSVSDTGIGMDPETKLRIFEPFFTTKKPGEGAGLGLSMVYGTVRQSGGHVVAYSEIDKGTTFKVYLPRVPGPAQPPEPVVPPGVLKGGNETVLVVEDEPPLRRLIARILGDMGYRIFVAGSGPEALELLEDLDGSPDLLITDVVLPGSLQGNELARECVAAVPGLPVLYMSGHPRDTIVHAGRIDEGVNFLSKPFTPQGLAEKVREVLSSRPR